MVPLHWDIDTTKYPRWESRVFTYDPLVNNLHSGLPPITPKPPSIDDCSGTTLVIPKDSWRSNGSLSISVARHLVGVDLPSCKLGWHPPLGLFKCLQCGKVWTVDSVVRWLGDALDKRLTTKDNLTLFLAQGFIRHYRSEECVGTTAQPREVCGSCKDTGMVMLARFSVPCTDCEAGKEPQ